MTTFSLVSRDQRRVVAEVDSWRQRDSSRSSAEVKSSTNARSRDMSRRMAVAMRTSTGDFILSDD